MEKCTHCSETLVTEDAIVCSVCTKNLHFACAGFSEVNFRKMSKENKAKWKCAQCRQPQTQAGSNPARPPASSTPTVTPAAATMIQQVRTPPIFSGMPSEDVEKWLKEYDRAAKYNRWDDMMCLANVFFFLAGTAKQWFENNEGLFTSWGDLTTALRNYFGDPLQSRRRAEEELKCRAQNPGESTQAYIQDVLALCHRVNAKMPEAEVVAHLMKGVAEDMYKALLTQDISSAADFMEWCRRIEMMQQKRIRGAKFERLPNVTAVASINTESNLTALIRQVVQEEIRKYLSPQPEERDRQALINIVRQEVQRSLSPVSRGAPVSTPDVPAYDIPLVNASVATLQASRRIRPPLVYAPRRKTDVWRTEDNRPVCFRCGRPGHVVRYCRERQQVFNDYRDAREQPRDRFQGTSEDYSRSAGRSVPREQQRDKFQEISENNSRSARRSYSPASSQSRSPPRRGRSPSPYPRTSRSPNRRTEVN